MAFRRDREWSRRELPQAQSAALAELAATPADVPLMPGVNWPLDAGALILGQWRAQIARNEINDKDRPEHCHWRGRLSAEERADIRSLYASSIYSQRGLAKLFNVSQPTIWSAIHAQGRTA